MTKPLAGSSAMETRYFIGLTPESWRLRPHLQNDDGDDGDDDDEHGPF